MNRRDTVIALAALGTAPLATRAQQARAVPVIGFLDPRFAGTSPSFELLRAGLRATGYVDGETIRIDARWGEGKPEALPRLAQELVQQKVDIIVAASPVAVRAAKAAARDTTPIVAVDLESDPVASGLATSLSRPGGNLTGLFLNHAELAAKWLQLMREFVPGARRFAVLRDVNAGPYQIDAITATAKAMAVSLQVLEFRDAAGMQAALVAGLKDRPEALVQLSSPLVNAGGKMIAELLAAHRLPGISPFRSFTDGGGLVSYGPDLKIMYRRLAVYVTQILKGAKPADLPIEQPTHFELIVSQKAAKGMGVKIPPSILVRADEVID